MVKKKFGMTEATIAAALIGLVGFYYFSQKSGDGGGGGGPSGGGSILDILTGSDTGPSTTVTETKKEGGESIYRVTSDLFTGTRTLTGNEAQGPGGISPGAFGNTALIGTYGGEREAYFKTQAAAGNLFGTTGSIYGQPKTTDIISQYTVGGSAPVMPLGAAGAVQELKGGGIVTSTPSGGWEYTVGGQVQAGGSAGSRDSAYGTIFGATKKSQTSQYGTYQGFAVINPPSSQGIVQTTGGSFYTTGPKAGTPFIVTNR